ncbi:MAG TPA: hypothetical protein VNB90_00500 [Cytophagaceae bacterium]|nr:hypothetical protein [Cytophagaceae bacterium]
MDSLNIATYLSISTKPGKSPSLRNDILSALLYFDLFHYPLTSREIYHHCQRSCATEEKVCDELERLVAQELIYRELNFFSVSSEKGFGQRRLVGNKRAAEYTAKAQKISGFIASFPFVRGIFLSGSVSKGYANEHADIDYFIVTAPGRLWFARTLLILFKKIFLLNSRKYFCLNYFIDENHLEIPDKNLFTAIELSYLLPVYNEALYEAIVSSNEWTKEYFPFFNRPDYVFIPTKKRRLKKTLEKLSSGTLGNKLDELCMRITERFWKYKFRKTPHIQAGIRCRKHVSKFHPQNFQDKILFAYEEKIKEFSSKHVLTICD